LASIPLLEERLRCWSFLLEFKEHMTNIAGPLNALDAGIKEVRGSEALKQILGVILALGNYMNGGTNKGQADGFNLDVLNKLSGVKDGDNKMSLFDYAYKLAKNNFPDNYNKLGEQLQHLDAAIRVSLEEVKKDLAELTKNFNNVQKVLEAVQNNPLSAGMTTFLQKLPSFMTFADTNVKKSAEMVEKLNNDFIQLCIFFGMAEGKAKSETPEGFFSQLKEFVAGWAKKAQEEEAAAAAAKKRQAPGRPIGQKVGPAGGSDPLAALASAIKLGQRPMALKKS